LDTLVVLSEDLAKQDTAFESSANKLVEIIRSLLGAEATTKLAGSLSVNESKFCGLDFGGTLNWIYRSDKSVYKERERERERKGRVFLDRPGCRVCSSGYQRRFRSKGLSAENDYKNIIVVLMEM
jgi:hypothetical protein